MFVKILKCSEQPIDITFLILIYFFSQEDIPDSFYQHAEGIRIKTGRHPYGC